MSPGRTFGTGRKAAIFLNVTVMTALAALAAGITIYLTGFTRLERRIDLTHAETYSLTSQTQTLVENLERDVEIITVTDSAASGQWDPDGVVARAMEYVRDLLQEYKVRAGGRIAVENLDVHRDPGRVRDIQREIGITFYNFVLVRSGKSRRLLQLDPDLADFVRGDVNLRRATQLVAYRVEEAISSAIFGVQDEKKPRVYVITGHKELDVSKTDADGGALVGVSLGRDNIDLVELPLFQTRAIPDDAEAVFLIGPEDPFVEDERAAIDAYLRKGGHLLACIDPFSDRSLDTLWSGIGIELETNESTGLRNVVAIPPEQLRGNARPTTQMVGSESGASYGSHVIVDGLRTGDLTAVLEYCAAIRKVPGFEKDIDTLITSYRGAFGDIRESATKGSDYKRDSRVEIEGQRILGCAIEPSAAPYQGSRIVFLSSALCFTNSFLGTYKGNDEFLRHATSWLIGRKKGMIAPPPRLPPPTVTELKPEEYEQIALYTMVILPGAAVLLTILSWLARRR